MSEGSHYYTKSGEPRYEYKGRPTTLAHARALGWVPSVSTVLGLYPSFGLKRALENNMMDCASDNPRHMYPDLTPAKWRAMIRERSKEHIVEAARIGTIYHEAIEAVLRDEEPPESTREIPVRFFPAFREWWSSTGLVVMELEVPFAHPLGYGGRIDCIAQDMEGVVYYIDWKTQEPKNGKSSFYDKYPLQLEAYARGDQIHLGVDYPRYQLMSVVIQRNDPTNITTKEWEDNEFYWDQFAATLTMWKGSNNYDPSWEE